MTRYAFIKDDLPEISPKIMVVIAQQDGGGWNAWRSH